jgi:hypothetical protein
MFLKGPSICDILTRNGDLEVIPQVRALAEDPDDPPVIIDFSLNAVVAALNNPVLQIGAPLQPFPLALPTTDALLKTAILNFIRAPGSGQPVGTCVLPCTADELMYIGSSCAALAISPWILHFDHGHVGGVSPIGRVYIPRPRSNSVLRCRILNLAGAAPIWI